LLVHVVDASAHDPDAQIDAVGTVLDEIGAAGVPQLLAVNKIDVADDPGRLLERHAGSVAVSARTGAGVGELLVAVGDRLRALAGLVTHRTKRHQLGLALVEGVRPVAMALDHGWRFQTVVTAERRRLSDWAASVVARVGEAHHVVVVEPLMRLLTDREELPELVGVVATPATSLDDIGVHDRVLVVVL